MTKKIKTAVVGASGYIGGEAVRLLLGHPDIDLVAVTGNESAGKRLDEIQPNLRGYSDLVYQKEIPEAEVYMLSLPHGEAQNVAPKLKGKVVDLSGDFRLQDTAKFEKYYKAPHKQPELLKKFAYGIPEINRSRIKEAQYVAAGGCFASAAILSLWPLRDLTAGRAIVDGKTGSSGSGIKPGEKTHHPFRASSFFAYEMFHHRHTPEIEQASGVEVLFQPHSTPLVRGVFTTSYVPLKREMSADEVLEVFKKAYPGERFVRLSKGTTNVNNVKGSNFIDIGVAAEGKTAIVFAAIDNTVKGGAGQGVQCLNLMCGLPEEAGLLTPPPPNLNGTTMTSLLKTYKTMPLDLARGEDVWVWDTSGRKYLDLYAGHAVCSTGHCHPKVVKAIQDQVGKLIFYSNVASFPLREEAAALLLKHAPAFNAALFANSGAEANENALKMARRHTGRPGIVAMIAGFHGRTAGAISATGIEKYRKQSEPLVPGISFVPFGQVPTLGPDTAAVILEPIQSMAGCRTAPAEYFQKLREACTKNGSLLIYDEVQTGIGRTGTMFFTGRYGVNADLITLAKAIGSGIPLSAVLATREIADKVQYGEYGATFGAGPVAMAAMKATLEVVEGLLPNVVELGAYLRKACEQLPGVQEVRGMGFLVGLKIAGDAPPVQKALLEKGFITGTADEPGVLRLLPPLTLTRAHVDSFLQTLGDVLKAVPATAGAH